MASRARTYREKEHLHFTYMAKHIKRVGEAVYAANKKNKKKNLRRIEVDGNLTVVLAIWLFTQ